MSIVTSVLVLSLTAGAPLGAERAVSLDPSAQPTADLGGQDEDEEKDEESDEDEKDEGEDQDKEEEDEPEADEEEKDEDSEEDEGDDEEEPEKASKSSKSAKDKAAKDKAAKGKKGAETPAEPPKPAFSEEDAKLAAWKTIAETAGAVTACTQRYVSDNPKEEGFATLAFTVSGGRVSQSAVETPLRAADRLKLCLSDVTRSWSFPEVMSFMTSIQIPVAKGAEFKVLKPGEKPPAVSPGDSPKKQREKQGWIQFTPRFLASKARKG